MSASRERNPNAIRVRSLSSVLIALDASVGEAVGGGCLDPGTLVGDCSFTGRFGPGTGEVLFDRICRENGIKHILTRPRSPTTTGKIERWHKTLRVGFLTGKVFDSIADAQAQLDV